MSKHSLIPFFKAKIGKTLTRYFPKRNEEGEVQLSFTILSVSENEVRINLESEEITPSGYPKKDSKIYAGESDFIIESSLEVFWEQVIDIYNYSEINPLI